MSQNTNSDVPGLGKAADVSPSEAPRTPAADGHPHLHALAHALSIAGQVYGDALASLVTTHRPPPWERAVREYDRTHPARAQDGPS